MNTDFIFRNNTVIMREAKASLDIAVNDLGKKNIGIISIKTDWGVSTSGIVKDGSPLEHTFVDFGVSPLTNTFI